VKPCLFITPHDQAGLSIDDDDEGVGDDRSRMTQYSSLKYAFHGLVGMHYGSLMLSTASAAHFIIIGLTCFSQSGMALDHHRHTRIIAGASQEGVSLIIASACFAVGNNIIVLVALLCTQRSF